MDTTKQAMVWGSLAVAWLVFSGTSLWSGRWFAFPTALPRQSWRETLRLAGLLGLVIFLYILAFCLTAQVLSLLGYSIKETRVAFLARLQAYGSALAAVSFWLGKKYLPKELSQKIFGESASWRLLVRGLKLGAVFYPTIAGVGWIVGFCSSWLFSMEKPRQLMLDIISQQLSSTPLYCVLLGGAVTFIPYLEELVFRGLLQGLLCGCLPPFWAITLTALSFSSVHYSAAQRGSNVEILASLFVFSVLASQVRLRAGSVYASIGMHAAFNAVSLGVFLGQGI